MICHEAVAMALFLRETVYSPVFTSRVEFTVETLRIWISIHLQKSIQASCWDIPIWKDFSCTWNGIESKVLGKKKCNSFTSYSWEVCCHESLNNIWKKTAETQCRIWYSIPQESPLCQAQTLRNNTRKIREHLLNQINLLLKCCMWLDCSLAYRIEYCLNQRRSQAKALDLQSPHFATNSTTQYWNHLVRIQELEEEESMNQHWNTLGQWNENIWKYKRHCIWRSSILFPIQRLRMFPKYVYDHLIFK